MNLAPHQAAPLMKAASRAVPIFFHSALYCAASAAAVSAAAPVSNCSRASLA
jgi:hypothetical protein